ncbi:MAG: hypothetical protein ISP90_09850 [Nevskia sp.]|nr:hypothetical protein [Nevskia sp.]
MTRCAARAAAVLLGVFLAAVAGTAQAEDLTGRRLTFGGFGTLGVDYNFARNLQFRRSVGQPDSSNGRKFVFSTDSLVGLQVNAAWSHELEVVLQAVSQDLADRNWRPRLTRGFVRYLPDESIMLRGGRIGWEFYPRADSSNIGYTFLTLRPPVEMFGQISNQDFDGGDVTLMEPLWSGLGRFKLFGGATSGNVVLADGSSANLGGSQIWGVQADYSRGPWMGQVGIGWYLVGHPPSLEPLVAGLRLTGQPQAAHLADEFEQKGRRNEIISAALVYDEAPWQGRLYLARTQYGGPVGPKLNIGLVSVGYSIGKFTPYGLLSRAYNYAGVQPTGLPDLPPYAALNAGAYSAQTLSQTNQSTAAAGLRYDFARRMDLKFQVDEVWTQGSVLVFDRNTPPRGHANLTVIGLAFDFVF